MFRLSGISVLALLLICFTATAQIPQGISYQAIARQSDGDELINTALSVKLGIIDASSILEYEEVHSTTSNDYGLINLVIGQGVITGNGAVTSFSDINWGSGDHFLRVEIDYPGSSGFELIGESQLLSVPYALFAASSGPVEEQDGDVTNELIESVNIDQQNGNLTITEGGNTFEVVIPLNDADADSTNELITSAELSGNGTVLEIEQQGQTISVDLEPVIEGTWQEEPGRVFNNTEDIGIGTTTPSSSLHVQGSYSAAVQVLAGPQVYLATDADQVIICNVSAGSITLTLPNPAT
ncbi:MAG: hypothetical protein RL220_1912, partial [Bacteroidota bacterium]